MGDFKRIYKGDLTDRQIIAFWRQVENSGRSRKIGFDCPPFSAEGFCHFMRREDVHPWWITFRDEPIGLFFLTDRIGKTAQAHFVTLPQGVRRIRNKRISVVVGFGLYALGKSLWERNVSGGFLLDTLIGVVPTCNKEAVKFAASIGGTNSGLVPGACYFHDTGENVPGVVMAFTRENIGEWATGL